MFPGISGMLGFRVLSESILRLVKRATQLVLLSGRRCACRRTVHYALKAYT